ncbi:MAG: MaoC/PaaZ C-terminal domain-containing protein [Elioraea sp.]|nr:MaoC/PaaZ C-terminal domain-containing protein [Elioraea sp.]
MSAFPAYEIHVTRESVSRWLLGRDGHTGPPPADGVPVPLAYFVFLRMQPILGVSVHALLGRDPDRGLLGGVTYRAERLPRVGECLRAQAAVTERKTVDGARGKLTLTTLANRYRNGKGTVLEEAVRMVDLPPGPSQPPARGPHGAPRFPRLAELAPLTRVQIAWLTVETGDMNPLHLDPAYAKSRLYPEVVVPGTLIAALAEREAVRALAAPLAELDLRLHAPTYPGEALAFHGGATSAGLEFEMLCGEELRATGRARAADAVS